tara:strand:- start:1404 stop:1667 length:264 start_codon:yes stop_codon:yes gene_type:complete
MPKFRKKPVVIEAVQYGPHGAPTLELLQHLAGGRDFTFGEDGLTIHTLEGDMKADIGDWVIKGISGECYPCKPDIFEATYEAIQGDD